MVMTNELPEVGSRWTIDGDTWTVSAVIKRGRGYYIAVEAQQAISGYRLQDFRKKAKAAEGDV
jgi:hypothetical protein